MMNFYKKTIMVAIAFAALSLGNVALADRCQSCAEKMAIKQSIKDVLAAELAINSAVAREKELDTEIEKCGCSKPKPKPGRAAHNAVESSAVCASDCCVLSQQLKEISCANAACCKVVHRINDRVKEQGRDAKKCCHQVKDRLDDIEALVISIIDQPAGGSCSSTDALLISLIDQEAACCSSTEVLLLSIISQNAQLRLSASITDLIINQIFGCTCL